MGQQNEKIYFEDINAPQQNRKNRHIFIRKYQTKQKHKPNTCDRPDCKCPSQHVKVNNLKLCSSCNNPNAPTIWKNKKLSYESASTRRTKHSSNINGYVTQYRQPEILEKQQPVYYYNAWGLPIQKCFVDAFAKDGSSAVHQIPPEIKSEPQSYIQSQAEYIANPPTLHIPPKEQTIPKNQPVSPRPVRPIPINFDQVNINDRVQNLFLF